MIKKIKNLPYPILGGAIGLGLATVILNIGFFRTIFVVALVGTGAAAGWYLQNSRKEK